MVEISKLIKADNKPTSQSAKTTIPKPILNKWDLTAGDDLVWEFAECIDTGEEVVIVRPTQPQKAPKVKKCKN